MKEFVKEKESKKIEKVKQEQIHELLFGQQLSWQSIIYDLINSEQLNPWDIDIVLLANKYLERVKELEEADFFVSSKVLFAASLLLRIKSDILLNQEIPSLDDILFGKKEKKTYLQERIELDEEIPELIPRTPLPRIKRVTLQELMSALGRAIQTESRRIKREIILKQRLKEAEIILPKNLINIREKMRELYIKIKNIFHTRKDKLAFSELLKMTGEEKLMAFISLLHLDNQQKIWLEQDNHFEEIWILLKKIYEEQNKEKLARLKEEVDSLELRHEAKVIEEIE